jgi:TolB-like protein/tetratricopeptide (TPR) repeat protein
VTLHAGTRLGPYEVLGQLGAGGMGEVWRARDPRLEREVALKVLPAAAVADETARARLLREARMAAKLNHPGICTIHEVGEAEGQAYIAMELVAGQSLADRLAAGRLTQEQAIRLGQQMADALSHAHEHSVVHRDFKAANVIVTPEGRAKVLDFGLAKPLVGKELEAATTLTQESLTEAGAVVGTLAYMAPEQLRGKPADARSDVWALGVVLYEMTAGKRPFAGETGFEVSSAILNQAPRPLPAGVPAPLATIIDRCLAKEPLQRYQRAGEVRSALEAMLTGSVPAAWPGWRAALLSHRWAVVLAVVSALFVVVAGLDVGGVRSRVLGRGGGERVIRMAVLPFANLSGDPEQEYLSDGLTQEMIAHLGRLHPGSLSVIARTSVMRYKKAETPIDQIGRELGVDYVLEGSAQQEGSRVRITAELIRVKGQAQLWSESFEREMSGVLALQSDVARKVASALTLKLLPSEQARLVQVRRVNPEAHEAYLRGNHHWMQVTPENLEIAEKYFELALEKDPAYAPAYAGRAWVWLVRNQWGLTPPGVAGPKAKAAALRAIELDGTLAGAHEVLAEVRWLMDWDWDGAWGAFRRAIELNPNVATAQAMYAHFLQIMGHGEEALGRSKRSTELDPFNPLLHGWYAYVLHAQRRNDEAIATARVALRLQPGEYVALGVLWSAFDRKGMKKEAFESARAYVNVAYNDSRVSTALEEGYTRGGYAEAMKRTAEALITRLPESFALPSEIASFYAVAGESEKAVEWLEKGLDPHDPVMPYIGVLPIYDDLHADPRFQELMRKMNLPVASPAGTPGPTGATP